MNHQADTYTNERATDLGRTIEMKNVIDSHQLFEKEGESIFNAWEGFSEKEMTSAKKTTQKKRGFINPGSFIPKSLSGVWEGSAVITPLQVSGYWLPSLQIFNFGRYRVSLQAMSVHLIYSLWRHYKHFSCLDQPPPPTPGVQPVLQLLWEKFYFRVTFKFNQDMHLGNDCRFDPPEPFEAICFAERRGSP